MLTRFIKIGNRLINISQITYIGLGYNNTYPLYTSEGNDALWISQEDYERLLTVVDVLS